MSVHFSMWIKALRVIPHVDRAEWERLDLISRWLIASRSAVLVMTFFSAAMAGILAFRDGAFHPGLWAVMTLGLLLAHATNNMLNDLTDHVKGVDRDNYFRAQYGPQPLEHGLLSVRQLMLYIAVTGGLALLAGLYLVVQRGPLVLVLLGIGAFFLLFYTWPLKYLGLGEPAVLLVWGPLMVGGGYFVVTGRWSWDAVIASLPYALSVTSVLFGKHIDKLEADRQKGIRTLPVLLGESAARLVAIAMIAAAYLIVLYLVAARLFSPAVLIVALALPLLHTAVRAFLHPRPTEPPPEYPREAWPIWFVGFAFVHNRRFGALYMMGLLLDALWTRFG